MVDFEQYLSKIHVLYISDLQVFDTQIETIEGKGVFAFKQKSSTFLNEPDMIELDNYDLVLVDAHSDNNDEYMQQVNNFCVRFSHFPLIASVDDMSEENVLAMLSLGVQDVVDLSKQEYAQFQVTCKAAIARQLKSRIKKDGEELSSLMYEYGLDIIFLVTCTGDILYVSPNVSKLLGYKHYSVVGSSVRDYFPKALHGELSDSLCSLIAQGEERYVFKSTLISENNVEIPAMITLREMSNKSEIECMVVNCQIMNNELIG